MNILHIRLWWILLLVGVFSLQSCATYLRSPTPNTVMIGSEPDGAKVYVDGVFRGATPLTTRLKPRKQYIVEMYKPGYYPRIDTIECRISGGWLLLDILSSPYILPPIIDANSGAWYEPKDDVLFRELIATNDSLPKDSIPLNYRPTAPSVLVRAEPKAPSLPAESTETKPTIPLEPIILALSGGFAFPSMNTLQDVFFFPTTFGLSIGYRPYEKLALGLTFESSGVSQYVKYQSIVPDSIPIVRITPLVTSIFVDARYRITQRALYAVAGLGALAVNQEAITPDYKSPDRLPQFSEFIVGASLGMGVVESGGGLFGEARLTFGFQSIEVLPYQSFRTAFFTLKLGYFFDGL